jgi:hypothetical protein
VGPRVVAGTARGHLLAWNATSDAADPAPRDLAGHAGPVRALAADELYVFSGGDDGELVVRDAATLERRWALRGHARPIVKVIPAGGLVMSLDNATLLVWRRPERPAEPTPGPGPSATMAPKGTVVPTQSPTPSPEPRLVERRCGDGSCSPGESSALCCRDCGCPPGLVCTDGECVTEREAAVITPEPTEEVIVLDAGPSTAPSPAPAMPRVPPAAVGAALVIVVAAGAVAADSGWKR